MQLFLPLVFGKIHYWSYLVLKISMKIFHHQLFQIKNFLLILLFMRFPRVTFKVFKQFVHILMYRDDIFMTFLLSLWHVLKSQRHMLVRRHCTPYLTLKIYNDILCFSYISDIFKCYMNIDVHIYLWVFQDFYVQYFWFLG